MPKKLTLLIDESGDQGLDRVMTHSQKLGASPFLTMGAALVPTEELVKLRAELEKIRATLEVDQLHCKEMSHPQVSYLAKEVSSFWILAFGVVSKKSTLGDYREMLEGDNKAQDYYNKCSQYLFELVASYAAQKDLQASDIDIVFEKKRGHDYRRLERYLTVIANNPIHHRAAKLGQLKPFNIGCKAKEEEPALSIADVIAYGLFKGFCAENNRLNLSEQRYLRELKPKFHRCEETGQIAEFGIKFIKRPEEMGMRETERNFALKFYRRLI